MLVNLNDGDSVAITISGDTRTYGPDAVKVRRDETSARGGEKFRYLTIIVPLHDGEFPETAGHVTG